MHLCIASSPVTALLLYINSIVKLTSFFPPLLPLRTQKEENESLCVQFTSECRGVCLRVFSSCPSTLTHTCPLCCMSLWWRALIADCYGVCTSHPSGPCWVFGRVWLCWRWHQHLVVGRGGPMVVCTQWRRCNQRKKQQQQQKKHHLQLHWCFSVDGNYTMVFFCSFLPSPRQCRNLKFFLLSSHALTSKVTLR